MIIRDQAGVALVFRGGFRPAIPGSILPQSWYGFDSQFDNHNIIYRYGTG